MAASKGKVKLKAAIYARKSREDKTDTSLSTQISECREFIKDYDGLLELDEAMIFQEDNVSGMQLETRKEFLKLLDLIETKTVDVVVVYRSDRFSRSSELMIELISKLEKVNAYLIAGDDLGDNSAAGILMKQIFWATNEFFVRKGVEDVMLVHSKLVENGYTVGGPGNYGYDIVDRKYVINPEEGLAVNMVFDLFLEGFSYTEIIESLEDKGFKPRKADRFSHSTIHAILSNKRNAGISVWNDVEKRKERKRVSKQVYDEVTSTDVVVEPIIPLEKFERVQSILGERVLSKSKSTHPYLLTSLVVCGECGQAITGNSQRSGRNKTVYRTYYCKNHTKKHGGTCNTKPINVEYLELTIKKHIETIISNEIEKNGFDEEIIGKFMDSNKLTISRLKREITQHESLLEKMTRGLFEVTSDAVRKATTEQIEKVSRLIELSKTKLKNLEIRLASLDSLSNETKLSGLRPDILFENAEISKRILRILIEKVTITNDEIIIDLKD